jgi:hypothetical protein
MRAAGKFWFDAGRVRSPDAVAEVPRGTEVADHWGLVYRTTEDVTIKPRWWQRLLIRLGFSVRLGAKVAVKGSLERYP